IVFSQLAIVDSRPVEADGRTHVWLKGSTKSKVSADAEACGSQLGCRYHFVLRQIVEHGATIAVELSNRCLRGILQSARASRIIEWNRRAWRFYAVIDLRSCNNKAVSSETNAGAQRGSGELEDVGVEDNAGKFSLLFSPGRREKHAEWHIVDNNFRIVRG